MLRACGVEYFVLMSEAERTDDVNNCTGAQLTNRIIELVNKLINFESVIVMAAD